MAYFFPCESSSSSTPGGGTCPESTAIPHISARLPVSLAWFLTTPGSSCKNMSHSRPFRAPPGPIWWNASRAWASISPGVFLSARRSFRVAHSAAAFGSVRWTWATASLRLTIRLNSRSPACFPAIPRTNRTFARPRNSAIRGFARALPPSGLPWNPASSAASMADCLMSAVVPGDEAAGRSSPASRVSRFFPPVSGPSFGRLRRPRGVRKSGLVWAGSMNCEISFFM